MRNQVVKLGRLFFVEPKKRKQQQSGFVVCFCLCDKLFLKLKNINNKNLAFAFIQES